MLHRTRAGPQTSHPSLQQGWTAVPDPTLQTVFFPAQIRPTPPVSLASTNSSPQWSAVKIGIDLLVKFHHVAARYAIRLQAIEHALAVAKRQTKTPRAEVMAHT